ncbi:MAG: hypothetical protein U0169_20545 [Polyangiaceae bacterium]
MTAWLLAFAFTQIVEIPIYVRTLRVAPLVAFGASALTHPIVWFVLPRVRHSMGLSYDAYLVIAETFAVVAEGVYFHALTKKKSSYGWSLVANATSVVLGLASRHFFGVP